MVLPSGGSFVHLLTDTASFVAVALYVLAFLLWDVVKGGKLSRPTLELILSLIVAMLVVGLLKVLTGVPRPGEAGVHWGLLESLKNADYFAFPSGHTTRAAVLAYFLSRRWRRLWPLWWGWAIGIAFSRLLLHVHWFSDVLFGLLLGPWVFMLVEYTESAWLPWYRAVIKKLRLGVLDVE
ncbi:phosphatase PAP2 family protein [Thermococcus celer]|uniref:phosphatase PAP2 family protein n=1 Tax=Thermococcus celer TaxID=2264 RepID=UPI001F33B289|nr:phosphatase PAP2 family protein [Thermococcus celer]